MKLFSSALVLLALLATLMDSRVMADEDVEVNDEEEAGAADEEDAYEDDYDVHEVTTSYHIPEYTEGRLPVGKPVTILVDFNNMGQDVFNVTRVAAFLHSPFDLNYFIQNFTAKEVGGMAAPSAQISLEYKVTPDQKLEALEYWLSGYVEYTMEGSDEPYRHVFVNTTVELFEPSNSLDFGSFFTMVLVMVALGVVSYIGITAGAEKMGVKNKKKKYTAPRAAPSEDDWSVDAYKQSDKSRRAGRNKKISKK